MGLVQQITFIKNLLAAIKVLKGWQKEDNWNLVKYYEKAIDAVPNKEMLVYVDEERSLTYKQVDELSDKFAKWAQEKCGVQPGSCVSLVMRNCPEFVIVWFAIAKIGAKTALINNNLVGMPLANCLKLAAAESKPTNGDDAKNIVIYGKSSEESLADLELLKMIAEDGLNFEFWQFNGGGRVEELPSPGGSHTWHSLDESLETVETTLSKEEGEMLRANLKPTDIALYIYTSGTTGLPKAAKISHVRFAFTGVAFSAGFPFYKSDRIYCPLPIFHSAGGMLGLSVCLHTQCTFIIRGKFSASSFFEDCAKTNATVVQYIGELLRYLNSTPPGDYDTKHKVRMAMGNGLRGAVWKEFQDRFKVKMIAEFYGATEGNASLLNTPGKRGAIGYMPYFVRKVYPVKIIRVDPEDEETPLRNKKGNCMETKSGEVGIAIGLIKPGDPSRAFDGYTNRKANEKKILKDVIKKGDRWFNSGDLLKRVGDFVYFVDRVGDTFRWKGENVSTREVEDVITSRDDADVFEEVNVYGVKVTRHDGRAGMAFIRLKAGKTLEDVDLDKLYKDTEKELTTYQRPIFLRFTEGEFELTATFKHKKVQLRKQGYDINEFEDKVFFRNTATKSYAPVDAATFAEIEDGKHRL